jgi:hypothetical protein
LPETQCRNKCEVSDRTGVRIFTSSFYAPIAGGGDACWREVGLLRLLRKGVVQQLLMGIGPKRASNMAMP